MRLTVKHCAGLFMILIACPAMSEHEEGSLAARVETLMSQVRNHETVEPITEQILAQDPELALACICVYQDDPVAEVRRLANALCWQIATLSPSNVSIRQEATSRLVKACADPDPLVWQHAADKLRFFDQGDYNDLAKERIRDMLHVKYPEPAVVLLCGSANLRDQRPRLRDLLINEQQFEKEPHSGEWYGTSGWAARLALARMGSEPDIARCIEVVESEKDPVVRVTVLLRDLAYIRQPDAVSIIRRYLNSDERLPAVREGTPGVRFVQYALDVLTEVFDGFPVEKRCVGAYSDAEIETCREWMKDEGNWRHRIRR